MGRPNTQAKNKPKKKKMSSPRVIVNHPQPVDIAEKTITDFFQGEVNKVDIDKLAEAGFIRTDVGEYFINDPGKSLKDTIVAYVKMGNSIYVQGPVSGDIHRVYKRINGAIRINANASDMNFIDSNLREETITALQDVQDTLARIGDTKRDSLSYIAFRNSIGVAIDNIRNTPSAEVMKREIASVAELADKYYIEKLGQRMNPKRIARMDMAKNIKDLNKAIQKDASPSEVKYTDVEKLRRELAEKFVKEYAVRRGKLKNNPEALKESEELLSDPKAFDAKVELALEQPYFNNLYGGADAESLEEMEKMRTAGTAAVFKSVLNEYKEPKAFKKDYIKEMAAVPPARIETYDKSVRLSSEAAADFGRMVLGIKSTLDSLGNEGRTSPEFKRLSMALQVAAIRLNSGETYINYQRMAAEIGDAADKYLGNKLETSLNYRGMARLIEASKLRHIADSVNKGVSPSKEMPDEMTLLKEDIATKIVNKQANNMLVSKDKKTQLQGKKLLVNPQQFKKNVNDVLTSDAFKNLVKDKDAAALREMLSYGAYSLTNDLATEAAKLAPKSKSKAPEVKAPQKNAKTPAFQL